MPNQRVVNILSDRLPDGTFPFADIDMPDAPLPPIPTFDPSSAAPVNLSSLVTRMSAAQKATLASAILAMSESERIILLLSGVVASNHQALTDAFGVSDLRVLP